MTVEWSTNCASGGHAGAVRWAATLPTGGWWSNMAAILLRTTPFSQRAPPSPLWSKASPKRRITPVAVASRAIEASVKGEGEGSGGGDGGPGENSPRSGVRRGRSPSPAPMYYIG